MKNPGLFDDFIGWFLRISLASGFLSAVGDRFGLWGTVGKANVAWGNWNNFLEYVATLNGFVPVSFITPLGWTATIAEIVIAIGLLIGWKLRWFSIAAGVLLLMFAIAMTFATGVKSALDASVFAASAGAFLLAFTLINGNPQSRSNSKPPLR